MPVRLRIVSDTHLSTSTPEAVANFRAVVDDLAADPPDVLVHTGDLTADGAVRPDDLALAAAELARVPVHWFAVPGNHDVGDDVGARDLAAQPGPSEQPGQAGQPPNVVSSAAVERFRQVIGPDWWAVDAGPWRLIGVDDLLLGSGLPEEAEQLEWLEYVLDVPTPKALFTHKPLVPPPGINERSDWRYPPEEAARQLGTLLIRHKVRTVVSGHLHEHTAHVRSGVAHVWAPTAWAVLPDTSVPILGERTCGVLDLLLGDDGTVQPTLRFPPGLAHHVLGENVVDPYAA